MVAFLGTPGVGLSSEEGAAVAWFPLAPGEAYWPSYARDVDYVRALELRECTRCRVRSGCRQMASRRLEIFDREFANREFATVVPRSVFINGRPVAPARLTLPEQRLQNAPVLMASPQIAAAFSAAGRPRHEAANAPPDSRDHPVGPVKGSRQLFAPHRRNRAAARKPALIRGAHLHTPTYAGQPAAARRSCSVLAYSRAAPGKKGYSR